MKHDVYRWEIRWEPVDPKIEAKTLVAYGTEREIKDMAENYRTNYHVAEIIYNRCEKLNQAC